MKTKYANSCRRASLGTFAFMLALLASAVYSQEARNVPPMEIFPPHIQAALDQHREATLPGSLGNSTELQGVFNRTKLWGSGQTLKVCFRDGIQDIRSRVARTAKQWEKAGNIKLDFGDLNNPRFCSVPEISEIRIGFAYSGYWSLVGQDSVNFAGQTDQSLNLALFNVSPPSEPEFSRVVLHEFGHAIGLQHEHQNPQATCESEFNWEAIYAALAGPPNYWDKAKVDFNMRRLLNDGNVTVVGGFNRKSIMLYTFPDWMYKDPTNSQCFNSPNYEISDGDRTTVAAMYPSDPSLALKRRSNDTKALTEALSAAALGPGARDQAIKNLEILTSPLSGITKRDALQQLNAPTMR